MPRAAAVCLVWLAVIGPTRAAAQAQTPAADPPGPYVVDVRVGTSTLPRDATFFPPAPSGTLIPTRALGLEVGGHVYLMTVGPARVGIGASLLHAGGQTSPPTPSGGASSTTTLAARPKVEMRITTIAPQVSFNFGTTNGWSYLSAGIGRADLRTTVAAFESDSGGTATTTPERSLDSGALRSINLGGGARWFMKAHLAFSFDVRFHLLAAGSGETATPGTTLVAVSAGISLR
ncbi:MAG: hypothetical protein ACRD3C_20360 [Vicinamibacterales bacterium]